MTVRDEKTTYRVRVYDATRPTVRVVSETSVSYHWLATLVYWFYRITVVGRSRWVVLTEIRA